MDTAAIRKWAAACVHSLATLQADIDGINVYPVADSDTGSNLLHTLSAGQAGLAAEPENAGAGAALSVFAQHAVRSAHGNSGVIVSQILRGLADSVGTVATIDGPALATALQHADRTAREAVAEPVEGTILSVLHAVANTVADSPLDAVVATAAKTAADALTQTPYQLSVLASAGVVDAGGRGLVAVLDALAGVVTGEHTTERLDLHPISAGPPAFQRWEVMYLLPGVTDGAVSGLREKLGAIGDSVSVAGDGAGHHMVHVHCENIGAAIEAGLAHGRPHNLRVEPLLPVDPERHPVPVIDRAVVAVVHTEAVAHLLRGEGVSVLTVPPGDRLGKRALRELVLGTGARNITVVPGSTSLTEDVDRICGDVQEMADHDVVVVRCASPVQTLSALAVHDPTLRPGPDAVAMAEAAAATRRGELLVAQEESLTWVGRAQAGEAVGLVDGEVVLITSGARITAAALDLVRRMLAVGGELVTVLTGSAAPADLVDALTEWLRAEHPEVELVSYPGGQTDALLLVGVE